MGSVADLEKNRACIFYERAAARSRIAPSLRRIAFCLILALVMWPSAAPAGSPQETWVSTWGTAPHAGGMAFDNQTIRMVVRSTLGGDRVRVRFSNLYGTAPLSLGSAHVALIQQGSAIVPGSDRVLTFGGKPSMIVPPGADALSDPVDLVVPQLTNLAVSVFVPTATSGMTAHQNGLKTTYISPTGDFTGAAEMPPGSTTLSYYWVTDVYVAAKHTPRVVVAFGDSITDGAAATPNADSSWPSVLGELLITGKKKPDFAVVNEGIGGNRILHDGFASNALARFDRDAIDKPGVDVVILLEGINDIGAPFSPDGLHHNEMVTSADLIQAMQQIIARCHLHKIKIVGATLTPYEGAGYQSPAGETIREAVNQWIRTSGAFDAVVDFDQATEDPTRPGHFLPAYDSGDHLHPNDAGYKAMATAAFQVVGHLSE